MNNMANFDNLRLSVKTKQYLMSDKIKSTVSENVE